MQCIFQGGRMADMIIRDNMPLSSAGSNQGQTLLVEQEPYCMDITSMDSTIKQLFSAGSGDHVFLWFSEGRGGSSTE
jgi:hypothetical protein